MGKEEQQEEREVLDSIFPEEITDLADNSYRIEVKLEASSEEDEPPILWLTVTYPETYPDVAPELTLSAPPNAPKHPDLDIQDDKARLLEALEPTIEESMGMAMVFTLVSALKDSAELLIAERQNAATALREVEAAKQEAKENEKFHGTAVTAETFKTWRDAFVKEMEDARRKAKDDKDAEDKRRKTVAVKAEGEKMSGRMLWEKGLAGKAGEEEDEEEDEGEDASKGVEKMSVKA